MQIFILYILLLFSNTSKAGEFFEVNGIAVNGYDPVSFFVSDGPVLGSPEFVTTHKGSIFHFSSKTNRDSFLKTPEKYSPQFNGFCAYGTANGYKAKSDSLAYTIVNGKLYLNYDTSVKKKWLSNKTQLIQDAEQKWPEVMLTKKVYQ